MPILIAAMTNNIKVWQMPVVFCLWSSLLEAFVKAKFFHTNWLSHKLSNKYLGPFEILAQAGSHSCILQLPDTFHGVHPVFHVSMLKPATLNEIPNCIQSPPPPIDVQGKIEYEISEVVDSKVDRHWSCKLLYLVHWLADSLTFQALTALKVNHQVVPPYRSVTGYLNFIKPDYYSIE